MEASIDELLWGIRYVEGGPMASQLVAMMRTERDLLLQRSLLGIEPLDEPVEPEAWPEVIRRAREQQQPPEPDPSTAELIARLTSTGIQTALEERLAADADYELPLHELQLRASDDMDEHTLTRELMALRGEQ